MTKSEFLNIMRSWACIVPGNDPIIEGLTAYDPEAGRLAREATDTALKLADYARKRLELETPNKESG